MCSGSLVFVDVDTQRDFLDPEGVLFIAGSEMILANLGRLTDYAREHGIPVLATACAHTPADIEFERFPPHCLVGTIGQERVAATAWPDSRVLGANEHWNDPPPPHLTVQKRELDVFNHADIDHLMSLYANGRPLFVVYGVATDYCVKCAVVGLLARGQRVAVVADAVWAFDPSVEPDFFADFLSRGAVLVATEPVLSGRLQGSLDDGAGLGQ
jgi:nicotinamidase/pyrazinamidase